MARAGLNEQIVTEAAARLVDSQGLDQLKITELANELGVRPSSLYGHVDGLEGLRRQLAILGLQRIAEWITNACLGYSGTEAIGRLMSAYRQFAIKHPGIYAAAVLPVDWDDQEWVEASNRVSGVIRQILVASGVPEDKVVHAVRVIFAAMFGYISRELGGLFPHAESTEESYQYLVDFVVSGIDRLRSGEGIRA